MGNIGRSSTGCGLCRKRKIKCDEGKPGCRRCAQVRKRCPGYPFQIQLDIRVNAGPTSTSQPIKYEASPALFPSDFAEGLPEEVYPSPPNPSPAQQQREVKDEGNTEKLLLQVTPDYRPTSPPRYDIYHQSICFFLHLFCYQAGRLYSFPVIDFLPDILQHSEPGSSVQLAAAAVSRMTLADQYSGKDVRLQTGREYGEALAVTNKIIRDPSENTKDDTVVAVWLLGLYEHINAVLTHGRTSVESKTPEEEWQSHISHIRGAMHLLKLRGLAQFTTARSEKIFRVLKAAIQMRLFILNSVTSQDFGALELDVYQDEHEFVPSKTANRASAYFVNVARLTERIKAFLSSRRTPENEAQMTKASKTLVRHGESLDNGMEDWSKFEPGWDMMKIHASTAGTAWALYPSHALYYYYSFWVYLYWIRYLIARVKLYEALIELVRADMEPLDESVNKAHIFAADYQISSYRTIIQLTSAELIGLTAYALGDVTNTGAFNSSLSGRNPGRAFQEINVIAAMQLVIPLKSLLRSEFTTSTQKGAIDLAISHIGDGFRRQPLRFT